ncbi:MAG: LAGLIDADG family homing endonuclease [Minisyncoccales bacterium]
MKTFNINEIVNEIGCFDLQFRRDVRHQRPGAPVYYAWKAQFVLVAKIDQEETFRLVQKILNCGHLHFLTDKYLRYSVQSIDDLYNIIVPYFKTHPLNGKKQKDFELWSEAIEIIYQNKGKPLKTWPRQSFLRLIEIQKLMPQYKTKIVRKPKWLNIAESILELLPE